MICGTLFDAVTEDALWSLHFRGTTEDVAGVTLYSDVREAIEDDQVDKRPHRVRLGIPAHIMETVACAAAVYGRQLRDGIAFPDGCWPRAHTEFARETSRSMRRSRL